MKPSAFIKNAWYVAGHSEDFGPTLKSLRLLNEDIVFFRKSDGSIAALEDACPHRKLPLSMGTLKNDQVICGYHGLTFEGSGKCVAAPTQEMLIPQRAKVRGYKTIERYGFVWIWMADQDKADMSLMIDIPNFDNPQWGRTKNGAMDIACNYLWITDNLLDPSHVAWVHVTSFGGAGTENVELKITELDDRVIVWRWIPDRAPPPYYAPFLSFSGHCDRKQHYECRLPSIAINKSIYAPVGTGGDDEKLPQTAIINFSYNFITPVDDNHSRYFWFQHRNFRPNDQTISDSMFAGAIMAFNEDKAILEAVHTGMKSPRVAAINLGLDAGAMRYRRLIERRAKSEEGITP